MRNQSLIKDYLVRSQKRMKAVKTLFDEESWADVVRESQEVLELTLKALLRSAAVEVPRIYDVSGVLAEEKSRLPKKIQTQLDKIIAVSKSLRRDRELAFKEVTWILELVLSEVKI